MQPARTVIVAIIVAISSSFVACRSADQIEATRTARSMSSLRDELLAGKSQIDRTMTAADEIRSMTSGDLRVPYDDFVRQLSRLQSTARRIRSRSADMAKRSSSYHDAWERQLDAMTSPGLRLRSAELQQRTWLRYESIQSLYDAAAAAARPLMADLTDIRTYLEFNLNAEGVQSIDDHFNCAEEDARVVKRRIDGIVAELDRASAALASRRVGP